MHCLCLSADGCCQRHCNFGPSVSLALTLPPPPPYSYFWCEINICLNLPLQRCRQWFCTMRLKPFYMFSPAAKFGMIIKNLIYTENLHSLKFVRFWENLQKMIWLCKRKGNLAQTAKKSSWSLILSNTFVFFRVEEQLMRKPRNSAQRHTERNTVQRRGQDPLPLCHRLRPGRAFAPHVCD